MPDPWRLLQILARVTAAAAASLATALSPTEVTVLESRHPVGTEVIARVEIYSGSADDPAGAEGTAWMAAGILRKEAADRAGALSGALEVSVGKDVTVLTVRTSPQDLDRWLESLAAALTRPAFDQAAIEAQREEQRRLLGIARSDPDTLSREAFDAFVFRTHPYAHAALGRLSAIAGITRDGLLAFHATHFRKGNVAVGIEGAFAGAPGDELRRALAALEDGSPPRAPRPVLWLARPRVLVVPEPSATAAWVRIGHPLNVTRAHPDFAAIESARRVWRAQLQDVDVTVDTIEPGGAGLPRRQPAVCMTLTRALAEAAGAVRSALAVLEIVAHGGADGPLSDQAIRAARAGLDAPGAQAAPAPEVASRLDDLLWRSPGFASRRAASLEAVTGEAARDAAARALFPNRAAIVAVVPDAAAFIDSMLRSGLPGGLTRDDFETLEPDAIFR